MLKKQTDELHEIMVSMTMLSQDMEFALKFQKLKNGNTLDIQEANRLIEQCAKGVTDMMTLHKMNKVFLPKEQKQQ